MFISNLLTESIKVGSTNFDCYRYISRRQHENDQSYDLALDKYRPVFMVEPAVLAAISINQTFSYITDDNKYRVQSIVARKSPRTMAIVYVEIQGVKLGNTI